MSDLDSLINSLNDRLVRTTGGDPSSRGLCGGCKQDILGRMVTAMNNTWHLECWKCHKCNTLLGDGEFYEVDSRPFCPACNLNTNYPKCDFCLQPISESYIEAMDKKFHNDHFLCTTCKVVLPASRYFPKGNKPYCESCVYKLAS